MIVKSPTGQFQAFHVQPNKGGADLLTFEQEEALKTHGEERAFVIVAKGRRSWFDDGDRRQLERMHLKMAKIIDVDTSGPWRLLYDPKTNEVWIDIKDKKVLRKYRGF